MPESPREDAVYANKANIVYPMHGAAETLPPALATAKTQHLAKADTEVTAAQARAVAQGATGTIKQGK